jgi:hypothetical protein
VGIKEDFLLTELLDDNYSRLHAMHGSVAKNILATISCYVACRGCCIKGRGGGTSAKFDA